MKLCLRTYEHQTLQLVGNFWQDRDQKEPTWQYEYSLYVQQRNHMKCNVQFLLEAPHDQVQACLHESSLETWLHLNAYIKKMVSRYYYINQTYLG